MDDREIRYNWLRDERNNPVACIASMACGDDQHVSFAISCFNPKDKFDKQYGKFVAEQRLEHSSNPSFTGMVNKQFNIKLGILRFVAKSKALPTRTKLAAEYRLAVYKERVLDPKQFPEG